MDTPHRKLVSATRFIFKKLTKSVRVTASYREAVVLLFESGKLIAWPFSKAGAQLGGGGPGGPTPALFPKGQKCPFQEKIL